MGIPTSKNYSEAYLICRESRQKVWELIALIAGIFPPSPDLLLYIQNFLKSSKRDPDIGKLATYSLVILGYLHQILLRLIFFRKIANVSTENQRRYPPANAEIAGIKVSNIITVQDTISRYNNNRSVIS